MTSKRWRLGALLFTAALAAIGASAYAVNIDTNGVICQNFNAAEALDIDYLSSGVRNLASAARQVICSVPRSPLADASTSGRFAVDGRNNAGTTTTCSVIATNGDGSFLGSQSFTETNALSSVWRHIVSLPSAQLPTSGYVSLLCTIPPSAGGVITGVTALQ